MDLLGIVNNNFEEKMELMEASDKAGGSSQLYGNNSKVEFSGNGISLYVDVFGTLNGTLQCDGVTYFAEKVLNEGMSEKENISQRHNDLLTDSAENANASVLDDYGCTIDMPRNEVQYTEVKGGMKEEFIESQQCMLFVGDLVWVKTKVQSWWPGLVCHLSLKSKDIANSEKDCLLVKYFGNANIVSCSPSQLKPFREFFKQISIQGNSRSFRGAVDRAVDEFGWQIKTAMTCSCIKKISQSSVAKLDDGNRQEESVSKGEIGKTVKVLVNQFEPATFLTFLRSYARFITMPGMIDLTVAQSFLSAFCRHMGHLQLPIHLLRPTVSRDAVQDRLTLEKSEVLNEVHREEKDAILQNLISDSTEERTLSSDIVSNTKKPDRNNSDDAEDLDFHSLYSCGVEMTMPLVSPETLTSIKNAYRNIGKKIKKKGSVSRERKRSKHLSPIYENISKEEEILSVSGELGIENASSSDVLMDINNTSAQTTDSISITKCSVNKTLKKCSRKPKMGHKTSHKVDGMSLSVVKMLSELHFTALNCFYPSKSLYFNSLGSFMSKFRKVVFHNVNKYEIDCCPINPAARSEVQLEKSVEAGKETPKSSDANRPAICSGSAVKDWKTINNALSQDVPICSARKKETSALMESKTNPTACLLDVNERPCGSGPMMINFEASTIAPKGEPKKRKRKKSARASLGFQEIKSKTGLPDLNGDVSGLTVEDIQGVIPVASHEKYVSLKTNDYVEAPSEGSKAALPDGNGNGIDSVSNLSEVQITFGDKLNPNIPAFDTSAGMDKPKLVSLCSSSLMEVSSHAGPLLLGGKRRRRKRKEKASDSVAYAIPDLNGNATESSSVAKGLPNVSPAKIKRQRKRKRSDHSKMPIDQGEAVGIALLLKFAPGSPLPSKEALVTTFCRFGPLKVLETNISNNGTAQVVFVRNSDAENALRSLEQSNPFGPGLISYRLHLLTASRVHCFESLGGFKIPATPSGLKPNQKEAPDLLYVKRNLEMMTSMLEKAGDSLSPDLRAKLESEVKGLMTKVSSMVSP